MSTFEIVLAALWLLMAVAMGLNFRSQLLWQRYYETRLGPAGITKSPVVPLRNETNCNSDEV